MMTPDRISRAVRSLEELALEHDNAVPPKAFARALDCPPGDLSSLLQLLERFGHIRREIRGSVLAIELIKQGLFLTVGEAQKQPLMHSARAAIADLPKAVAESFTPPSAVEADAHYYAQAIGAVA